MEGIQEVRQLLPHYYWAGLVDIKDAYPHIAIHVASRPWLQVLVGRLAFDPCAMLFGLAPAPWVFTKVMRFPVMLLRRRGIPVSVYLDNIIVLGVTKEEAN